MSAELEAALGRVERDVLARGDVADWLVLADRLRTALDDAPDDVRLIVLAMVAPQVERAALEAVVEAYKLGTTDALRILGEAADDSVAAALRLGSPTREAASPVAGLDAEGAVVVAQAQRLARADADAASIAAPVLGFARRLRGSVSDAVQRSGADAILTASRTARLPTVWVAETNACVHCLGLSGTVAQPGRDFDGSATYGRRPLGNGGPLRSPPRHPFCRCTLEPLVAPEYAAALRREADRSVLRGFSLESESMAVRIDAAERLIERGVDAPKSVIAFSRRAVRAGSFPTRGRPE